MAINSEGSYRNKYNLGIADFVNVVSFPDDFPEHCSAAFIKYADEGSFTGYSLIGFLDNISENFASRIVNDHIDWQTHDVRSFIDKKADSFLEMNAREKIINKEQFREDCFLYIIYRTKLQLKSDLKNENNISLKIESLIYPDYYYLKFSEFLNRYSYSKADLTNQWTYIEPVISKLITSQEAQKDFIEHLFKVIYSVDRLFNGDKEMSALQIRDTVKDTVDNYLKELDIFEQPFTKVFYDCCFLIVVYRIYAKRQEELGVDFEDTIFASVFGKKNNEITLLEDFDISPKVISKYDQYFSEFIKGISVTAESYVACLENISVGINIALPGNEKLKDFIDHLGSLASIIVKTNPENRYDVTASKLRAAVKDLIDMHLKNREADISVLPESFYDDCFQVIIYRIQMGMRETGDNVLPANTNPVVRNTHILSELAEHDNTNAEKRPYLVFNNIGIRDFVLKIPVQDNIALDLARQIRFYAEKYGFDMDKLIDYIDTITDEFMDAIIMKKTNPQVRQIRMSVDNRISLFLKDNAFNHDKTQARKLFDNCFVYTVTQIKLYLGDRITDPGDYFNGKQGWGFRQMIDCLQFITGKDADDARQMLEKKLRERYSPEITASYIKNLNQQVPVFFKDSADPVVKVSTVYGILSEFIDKQTEIQNKQNISFRIYLEDLTFLYLLYQVRLNWQSKLDLRLTANSLKKEIIEVGAQSMVLSFADYLEKVNLSEADIEKKSEAVIAVAYGILKTMALTESFISFLVDTASGICNTPSMLDSNVKDLRKEIRKIIKDFFTSNQKNTNLLSREFYDDCFSIIVSKILEEREIDKNSLETIEDEKINFPTESEVLEDLLNNTVNPYTVDYSLLFWDFVQETVFSKEVVENKLKRVLEIAVRTIPGSDKMSFTCYLIDVAWFTYNNTPAVFERPAIESCQMLKEMIKGYVTERNGNKNILTQSFYDDCVFVIFNEIQKRLNKDRHSAVEGVERRLPAKSIKMLLPDFSLSLPDFIALVSVRDQDYLDKRSNVSAISTGLLESIDQMKNFLAYLDDIARRFCANAAKAGSPMTAAAARNNAVFLINGFFQEKDLDTSILTTRFYDDCFYVVICRMQTLINEGKVSWGNVNVYEKGYIDEYINTFEIGTGDTGQRIYRESYNTLLKDFLYTLTFDEEYEQDTVKLLTSYSHVGGFSVSKLIHYLSAVLDLLTEDIRKNTKDWKVIDVKRYIDHKMDLFFVYNPDTRPGNKLELYDCCFAYMVYKLKVNKNKRLGNNAGENEYEEINNIGDLIYINYIDKMPVVSKQDINYAFDRLCLKESLLNKEFNCAHFKAFADSLVPKIIEASKSPGCKVFDILGYISQSIVNYRKLGENRCAGFTAFAFHYVSLLVKQARQRKRDMVIRERKINTVSNVNTSPTRPEKNKRAKGKKKKWGIARLVILILLFVTYLFICFYQAEPFYHKDKTGDAYELYYLLDSDKQDMRKFEYVPVDENNIASDKLYFKDDISGNFYLLTLQQAVELQSSIPDLREVTPEELDNYSGVIKDFNGDEISNEL